MTCDCAVLLRSVTDLLSSNSACLRCPPSFILVFVRFILSSIRTHFETTSVACLVFQRSIDNMMDFNKYMEQSLALHTVGAAGVIAHCMCLTYAILILKDIL